MTTFDHHIEDPRELGPDPHNNPEDHVETPWRPDIRHRTIAPEILAVAKTRREGKWRAYIAPTAHPNHDSDVAIEAVWKWGTPLVESIARAMFPEFEGVPYAG